MKTIATFLLTASILLAAPEIKITETFKGQNIKLPVALAIPPDGTERLFLVQQFGKNHDLTQRPLVGRGNHLS